MAVQIPQIEPRSARAGDTWRWQISLPDYPADTWTLTYKIHNAAALVAFSATADGTRHDVNVPATTTANYTAGRYDLLGQVTDGTDVYSVRAGTLEIEPAITAAADGRSHARKMLDAIEAILEGRANNDQLDTVKTAMGDRSLDREGLLDWRRYYARLVAAEEQRDAAAHGLRVGAVQQRF